MEFGKVRLSNVNLGIFDSRLVLLGTSHDINKAFSDMCVAILILTKFVHRNDFSAMFNGLPFLIQYFLHEYPPCGLVVVDHIRSIPSPPRPARGPGVFKETVFSINTSSENEISYFSFIKIEDRRCNALHKKNVPPDNPKRP